jgi:cation diffusion facilitator family transporter
MVTVLSRFFIKNYEQVNEHAVRRQYGVLCGGVGIALNIMLFFGKFFAGTISGSIAITADAFNNLSDAGSSLVTILGFKLAGQKPDPDHPFGHGRMEYLSGLVVAMLILLMGFELLKSSVEKIRFPEAIDKPLNALNGITTPLAMFVLGGSLHFSETKKYRRLLASGLVLRLVIVPGIALLAAIAASFPPAERFVIFACFATPSAAASYAMASAMGCDGELAGQFVVLGTVLSILTLFLWIFFMGQAGLL